MELREFWAKTEPFQSVLTHAMVSGCVAQVLLENWLSAGNIDLLCGGLDLSSVELSRFVGYLVSLHDIGKLEYSFQVQDEEAQKKLSSDPVFEGNYLSGVRHERTGRHNIKMLWKEAGEDAKAAGLLSKIIGAHHQGKNGEGNYRCSAAWLSLQKELEQKMRAFFGGSVEKALPQIDKSQQGRISVLLLGLMILSDWIASGEAFADAEAWIDSENANDRIRACASDFLKRSDMMPSRRAWPETFCDLWPNIPPAGRRPLQVEIERLLAEKSGAQLVLIEAPMGEGKTEAGVFAAAQMAERRGKDGLYFALPTAATSNQMVRRIRSFLDMNGSSSSVRLLHSRAWLDQPEERWNSRDEQDSVATWLMPVKRGLLGQYAVGTVDQAMLAATNVKYGVLRLLGLSNKALIIDEIHSYDAYMDKIIIRLLEWCRALEIPVVMLSATLPPEKKQKLLSAYTPHAFTGDYPLITAIDGDGTVTERRIKETSHRLEIKISLSPVLHDAEKIAELAVAQTAEGGCLCVLMNTVREAQEVYSAIRERYDGDLILFHAQFPAGQRAELEDACIRRYGKDKTQRPKRSILVATQVVEQSLDVDFDRMITAIAPVDLLMQRIGRVFRHDDTPRPADCNSAVVAVLTPERGQGYGASAIVYPDCLLSAAMRVLSDRPSIRIPEDLAVLVKEGYDPSIAPDDEIERWWKNGIKEQVEAGASQQYLLNPPDKLYSALGDYVPYEDDSEVYSLSVQTRLGEPTVRIALLPPEEMAQIKPFFKTVNGKQIAAVSDRRMAERVMRQSVSVAIRRLGGLQSVQSDICGAKLLSGLRILPTEDGVFRTKDGKSISFDPVLGLLIKEGEL